MKKIVLFLTMVFILSCTSNTIYEKPKNLIPRDTMVLLLKDMYIANSAKNIKNKNLQRRFSYLPLVYNKYQIDSTRFRESNFYYTSKIESYGDLLNQVFSEIQKEQSQYSIMKKRRDSIIQDSVQRNLKKGKVPLEVQQKENKN